MISRAMEDYLKTIFLLGKDGEKVSTSRLAQRMQCSAASVTNMLQKLSELKLVRYKPYQGVRLTDAGSKVALEVLRHHRLVETYLQEILGFSWDKVHDEAEQLEHVISEELEARMDAALGYPTRDPHGHPIPGKDGTMPKESHDSLWETPTGTRVKVSLVNDSDPEALRYLGSIGIHPQVQVNVIKKAPFNGPIHIQINDSEHSISEELARQIFVIPA